MVLGGAGTVRYRVDGGAERTIEVGGAPGSEQLLALDGPRQGEIVVTVPSGVTAYSFTFG